MASFWAANMVMVYQHGHGYEMMNLLFVLYK